MGKRARSRHIGEGGRWPASGVGGRADGWSAGHRWIAGVCVLLALLPAMSALPRADASVGGATQFRLPSGRQLIDSWASPTGQLAVTDVSGSPQRTTLYVLGSDASLVFDRDFGGTVHDITFGPNGDVFAAETSLDDTGTGYRTQFHRMSMQGLQLASSGVFEGSTGVNLEYGADDRLYAVMESNGASALTALDPVQLDVSQQAGLSQSVTEFHSRPDGLVVLGATGSASYLDYATLTASPFPHVDEPTGQTRHFSVANDTDVFELGLTFDPTRGEYPCDLGVATGRRRDGTAWRFDTARYFSAASTACKLVDIEALPEGGAVISGIDGFDARVRWLDDDGVLVASFDYAAAHGDVEWAEMSPRRSDLAVDGNGRVIMIVTVPDVPCPEGEYQQHDCSRLDVLGLHDGSQLFNVPIYGDTADSDPDDDSAGLYETGSLQQQEVRVVDGGVMFPIAEDGFYCGHACSGHYLSLASVAADVVRRPWQDPPIEGSTSPGLQLGVSPLVGPTGSSFSFGYRCPGTHALTVVSEDGSPASGVTIGVPVSGNGTDYTQSVTPNLPGIYRGRLACDGASAESAPFLAEQYKYVALGDSFSAGEGVEPFFDPTNGCHRSQLAYPTKVEQPGWSGESIYERHLANSQGLAWGFQACSGATTEDLDREGHHGDPLPQLQLDRAGDVNNLQDLPVDAHTDLVTLTIGGNDMRFADVLEFCYFSDDCTRDRGFAFANGARLSAYIEGALTQLSGRLDQVYAQLARQAPDARVLVLGYPQLFPRSHREQVCPKLAQVDGDDFGVPGLSVGFSGKEQRFFRRATTLVNNRIADRVATRSDDGFEFINAETYFAGHEICGSAGEWINAPTLTSTNEPNDQSFHPNECGQAGYAALVNLRLNAHLDEVCD